MEQKTSSRPLLALILGILGLVLCGIFTAIPAWIIGHAELKDIDAGMAPESGRTMALVGKILGIIGVVLTIVGIIAWFLFMGAMFAGAGLSGM